MPIHTILEALAAGAGYGKIMLQACADGTAVHSATLLYFKPKSTETIPAFLRRLQQELLPGDEVEISFDQGSVQLARVRRPAAIAGAA